MPSIKLTERTAAAAKADPGTRLELWDQQTQGLCLRVSESGKKVWIYRYRTADGRQPRLTLGDYSSNHGLRWARDAVDELRLQVRNGGDPARERRRSKAAAKAEPLRTFDDLADAYLEACRRGEWKPRNKPQRPRTISDETGILRRHIRPALGPTRIDDIDRSTIRDFLRTMVDRGIKAQTNRAHALVRQCFAYAISEERVQHNPAIGLPPLASLAPRTRVLTDDELRRLWTALESDRALSGDLRHSRGCFQVTVGRPVRTILQLCALLLQRRGEVAGMKVAELRLEEATWLIPAERMKGGRPHLVPLPPRAVQLIREAIELAQRRHGSTPCVFPSPRNRDVSVLGNSVTHAMAAITSTIGVEGVSPHDLRRTGSTALTSERIGVSPFIRSKVLGHAGDAGGGSTVSMVHYDANEYVTEKRRALEAWEALLLSIVGERA